MRRLSALAAAAILFAACGGSTVTDPYQIVDKSAGASYDVVQVNVGMSATGTGNPITIDPQAIQLVVDGKTGKAEFKLQLPLAALGADAAALAPLGVTGSSLDLDVVYDGEGLYANGPILTTLLSALMVQAGLTPGDLSGWLRLGTKAEFEALAGQLAPSAMPSIAPVSSHDAASIKKALEDVGVKLTYVGAEKRNEKDASHLAVAIDFAKLQASPAFDSLSRTQIQQFETAMQQVNVSADLWVDSSSYRIVEVDLHVAPKDGSSGKLDVTILIGTPKDTSGLTAPSTYTEVPMSQLVGELLKLVGQGMFSQ